MFIRYYNVYPLLWCLFVTVFQTSYSTESALLNISVHLPSGETLWDVLGMSCSECLTSAKTVSTLGDGVAEHCDTSQQCQRQYLMFCWTCSFLLHVFYIYASITLHVLFGNKRSMFLKNCVSVLSIFLNVKNCVSVLSMKLNINLKVKEERKAIKCEID
jgi:hypothetical protein